MNVIQVKLNVDIQHFRCLCLVANFHIFLITKILFVESLLMPLGFTNTEEKVLKSQFNLGLRQSYSATNSLTWRKRSKTPTTANSIVSIWHLMSYLKYCCGSRGSPGEC